MGTEMTTFPHREKENKLSHTIFKTITKGYRKKNYILEYIPILISRADSSFRATFLRMFTKKEKRLTGKMKTW